MNVTVAKSKPISQFDVVVVGSGPAGVHAAYPLVKARLRVAIIDGGLDSKWRFLPAKPPTLTIIANASRVGKNVLRKFH